MSGRAPDRLLADDGSGRCGSASRSPRPRRWPSNDIGDSAGRAVASSIERADAARRPFVLAGTQRPVEQIRRAPAGTGRTLSATSASTAVPTRRGTLAQDRGRSPIAVAVDVEEHQPGSLIHPFDPACRPLDNSLVAHHAAQVGPLQRVVGIGATLSRASPPSPGGASAKLSARLTAMSNHRRRGSRPLADRLARPQLLRRHELGAGGVDAGHGIGPGAADAIADRLHRWRARS